LSEIKNPHDMFFKKTMADKETAKDFLQNYLPKKVLKHIDLDKLKISKDSFVDEELKDKFSDVLYEVKLDKETAFIYLLFEHKSYPDKEAAMQLLRYMTKIWDLYTKQSNKKKLPFILPLVFYHGNKKWNIGMNLSDLLREIPQDLKEFIPDFKYLLYDFSVYSETELKGRIVLKLFIETMKYSRSDKFKDKLKELFRMYDEIAKKKKGMEYLKLFIKYILKTQEKMSFEDLKKEAEKLSITGGESIMTIAEKLKKEGIEIGKEEGLKKGREEGIISGLLEGIEGMIEIKYGESSLRLMKDISKIESIDKLEKIKNTIRKSDRIDEVEKLL